MRRGKSGFQRQFALLVDQFLDSSGSTRQFPDFFIPILGAGGSCGDSCSTVFSGYLGSCLEQCGLTCSSASLVNWVKFRDCLEQCGLNGSVVRLIQGLLRAVWICRPFSLTGFTPVKTVAVVKGLV